MIKVTFTNDAPEKIEAQIKGELNSDAIDSFNEQIAPLFDNAGREILLDLAALEFISSAGLRAILQINKKAQANGGGVTLTNVKPEIKQVLDLVGFANFMKVC